MSALGPKEFSLLIRLSPGLLGVGGHSLHPWVDFSSVPRRMSWITFLREPRSRLLSHFNHQRSTMGLPWRLEDFLSEPRFHDLQTRRLAGVPSFDEANRVLRHDFDFVGISDRYDESIERLGTVLGAESPSSAHVTNMADAGNPNFVSIEDLNRRQLEMLSKAVRLDLPLYEQALTDFVSGYHLDKRAEIQRSTGVVGFRQCPRLRQRVWSSTAECVAFWRWGATTEELRAKLERWTQIEGETRIQGTGEPTNEAAPLDQNWE